MTTESKRRSPIWRLLDVFLQEQNIRWLLCLGLLILLGSSLMLVTSNWDSYSLGWRLCVLLGYTASVHGLGQLTYHTLGLRKTGTGLMALTVLLLPLTFHALKWIQPTGLLEPGRAVDQLILLGALAAETTLCVLASKRIFTHFLRRFDLTFLLAYVALCLAAAVVPIVPTQLAPLTAAIVWSVFAVGAVRVNRHVFWMIEEHRWPRIFGFFPVLLLGTQFIGVFSISLMDHMPLSWIGVGIVLTAIPVLLAVDSLARVFLRRQGKLARPFPWSISLPLAISMALMATGICLSATRFPHVHEVVPASALAAFMLGLVARRTQQRGFVWAMLIALTMAYQFSPTFFREIAMSLIRSTANAMGEQRLPIAFYGLTYLPLLAVLVLAALYAERRTASGRSVSYGQSESRTKSKSFSMWDSWMDVSHDGDMFASVIRKYVAAVSCLLLAVAPTHPKALLPVGLAMLACFSLQMIAFQRRGLLPLALASLAMAVLGLKSFLLHVCNIPCDVLVTLSGCATVSTLLALWGNRFDRMTSRWLPVEERPLAVRWCELTGVIGVVATSIGWGCIALTLPVSLMLVVNAVLLAVMLLMLSLRGYHEELSRFTLFFIVAAPVLLTLNANWETLSVIKTGMTVLTSMWVGLLILIRYPNSKATSTFANSISQITTLGFGLMTLTVVWLPFCLSFIAPTLRVDGVLLLMSLLWAIGSAVLYESKKLATVAWINVLIGMVIVVDETSIVGGEWLPCLWTAWAATVLGVTTAIRQSSSKPFGATALISAWHGCATFLLGLATVASLTYLNWPMRLTGGLAAAALILVPHQFGNAVIRRLGWMSLNWQVLLLVLQVLIPETKWTLELSGRELAVGAPLIACLSATMALGWRFARPAKCETVPIEEVILPPSIWENGPDYSESDSLEAREHRSIPKRVAIPLASAPQGDAINASDLAISQRALLFGAVVVCLCVTLTTASGGLSFLQACFAAGTFGLLVTDALLAGVKRSCTNSDTAEGYAWLAEILAVVGIGYLALGGVITFGSGWSMYATLAGAGLATGLSRLVNHASKWRFAARPLSLTGTVLPSATVVMALARQVSGTPTQWLGFNSLALLGAGCIYFWRGFEQRRRDFLIGSAVILNLALMLLWGELNWSDPQFYMVPLGLSLIGLVELLRNELPERSLNPLRYVGSLVILVSPTFHIVSGSWLHIFSMMLISVLVAVLGIGLRLRVLLYLGTAFLMADLFAMVIRGGVDNPSILWASGIALGMSIVGLAAYCERHREHLLQQMRLMAAELESWR